MTIFDCEHRTNEAANIDAAAVACCHSSEVMWQKTCLHGWQRPMLPSYSDQYSQCNALSMAAQPLDIEIYR